MAAGRVECTLLWFIENYKYCWQKNEEKLWSPCFTVDELERTSWRIGVNPRGLRVEDKGWVSLYLFRRTENSGPETVSVNFELSALTADGSTLESKESKYEFKKGNVAGWGWFIKIEDVPKGTLTVRCRMWKGEGMARKVVPIFARTRISVENISFLHVVENFSVLKQNQKKTIEIRSHSKNGCVVYISLHFTYDSSSEGEMILEIRPSDCNHILCKRKVSLFDVSGNVISCGENDNRSDAERKDIQKLPLSLTRQAILNKKSEYLSNDKLSLLCECSFSAWLEFERIEGTEYQKSVPASKEVYNPIRSNHEDYTVGKASAYPSLSEDMKTLYMNQCLTDVELKTKTKSFPAHKSVLAARSPVFEAMFSTNMKERYKNCIQIDDLTDDTVQQMLLFLYSDKVENLQWKSASKLYYASDKYEVGKLKEICSSFLVGNLTANNAGELLVLADIHSDGDLKKSVEDFILEHEEQVFGSKEWETLIETNPLLVIKTMHLKYKKKNEQKNGQENKRAGMANLFGSTCHFS